MRAVLGAPFARAVEKRFDHRPVIGEHLPRRLSHGGLDLCVIGRIGLPPTRAKLFLPRIGLTMRRVGTQPARAAATSAVQQFAHGIGARGDGLRLQCLLRKGSGHFRRDDAQDIVLQRHSLCACFHLDL